jgi:hypothetical protein
MRKHRREESHLTLSRGFPQKDSGFEGQRKYLVFSPPQSMEGPLPHDSKRMPFRRDLPIPELRHSLQMGRARVGVNDCIERAIDPYYWLKSFFLAELMNRGRLT